MTTREEIIKNISKVIKKALENKKMSQTELAKKVGCDKTAISHYVSGDRVPKMDVLIAICKELDINLNSLMTGELSKATATETIPTSTRDVLLAVTTLIKAGYLTYEEQYGWYFSYKCNCMLKFTDEVDKFANSKFKDIDKILLSLVDTYYEDIENEIISKNTIDPNDHPF